MQPPKAELLSAQAAHAKEMDKVQTSCTSHLKHLQAMHGEELATIYAEMTQARSAAEELFACRSWWDGFLQ
jgi:hypothetical protein